MTDVRNKQQNTLLVTLEFTPFKGGVARYYEDFCAQWGSGMMVYTTPISNAQFSISNTTRNTKPQIIRRSFYWKWIWPRWTKLLVDLFFYFRKHPTSLVFVGNVLPVGTVVWILQQVFHFDYVVMAHGLDIRFATRSAWKKKLAQRILDRALMVIANSNYTAGVLRKEFDITDERVRVLLPKAATPSKSREQETRRIVAETYQLPINENDVIFLSVSRLVERKGYDEALEAFSRIDDPRVKYVIAGQGPYAATIEQSIREKKLEKRVFLLRDAIDDAAKEQLYAACDVFLLLPKDINGDVEGFGLVFSEAGMHAKPVIARDSGGVSEAVRHEHTGFLWDGNDISEVMRYINILAKDPERRSEFGNNNLHLAQEYAAQFNASVGALRDSLIPQNAPVSIIIPVYPDIEYLAGTLQSIARQTYTNYEVIIVGDGVKISEEQVTRNKQQETRTTILFQEHDAEKGKRNAAIARNRGAAEAHGEFLLFVDKDTELHPRFLEKSVRRLQNSSSLAFTYSGYRFGWKTMPSIPFSLKSLQQFPYIDTTSLLRSSSFVGFDASLERFQDWDLFLTIAEREGKGEWIPEILYFKHARLFKNLLKWKGISFWFPKFVWKIPVLKNIYSQLPPVKAYCAAEEILKKKHDTPRS